MTPRERAKKTIDSVAVRLSLADQDVLRDKIEQAIIADRQALQSEIETRIELMHCGFQPQSEWAGALTEASGIVQSVFAQQSQPEEKKLKDHYFRPYGDASCCLCSASASRHPKFVLDGQSTRIAMLHEWIREDARTVQQLNESNQELSEKIVQLEKEKNELDARLSTWRIRLLLGHPVNSFDCDDPNCYCDSRPAD